MYPLYPRLHLCFHTWETVSQTGWSTKPTYWPLSCWDLDTKCPPQVSFASMPSAQQEGMLCCMLKSRFKWDYTDWFHAHSKLLICLVNLMELHFMDLLKRCFGGFFDILHFWLVSGDSFSDYEEENIKLQFLILFQTRPCQVTLSAQLLE